MRTFTYLGPNTASLNVTMNGSTVMANNQSIRTWYFGNGFNDDRLVPSPVIECIEGQTVNVTLTSMPAHSIHFHGLDVNQANDGVGSTSGYVSMLPTGGNIGRVDGYTNLGSPFTYNFTAPHAGTYMYHCHIDTVLHIERGMYGTVIVRPPDGSSNTAWTGGPVFDREHVWHLHTFDSSWDDGSVVSGSQTIRYSPDYFMLNGRDGSVPLTDPTCAITADAGTRVLIRAINVGYQPAMVDLGGLSFQVIASDGRPLPNAISVTQQLITAGERYDILFTIPVGYNQQANIDYLDIRLKTVLGSVKTTVMDTSDKIFENGFEAEV